eukprot:1207877-Pleurochrysis_carterae.AAC.1
MSTHAHAHTHTDSHEHTYAHTYTHRHTQTYGLAGRKREMDRAAHGETREAERGESAATRG